MGNQFRPTPSQLSLSLFAMDQSQVEQFVNAAITKNNETLLGSMKAILNSSLSDNKRANSDTADCKKKANEDQFRFNSKLTDVLDEAKSSCSTQNLDKVKESLEKGENLLAERQKHILLADISDYGWMVIQEYKKNNLADDEKKTIRAEARARTKQNSQKAKSGMTASRREFPKSQSIAAASNTDVSSALRPIPTIDAQFRNQTRPGCYFACTKPGRRRVQCPLLAAKFKCEDLQVALKILSKGFYLLKFDLKSGYHHVEIFPDHRRFLAFSWDFGNRVLKYFQFAVLPFGLSSAPYLFTKLLRPVLTSWRCNGIPMVIFLDDGLGGGASKTIAKINRFMLIC